jgi:hypothetical protein
LIEIITNLHSFIVSRLKNAAQLAASDEQYFCNRYITRIESDLISIAIPICIAYNFASVPLIPLLVKMDGSKWDLVQMHVIAGVLFAALLITTPWKKQTIKLIYPWLLCVAPIAYLLVLKQNIDTQAQQELLLTCAIVLIVSTFSILISPSRLYSYVLLSLVFSGVGFYASSGHELGPVFGIIFSLGTCSTAAFRFMQHKQQIKLAKHEYSLLIKSAPAKIIRHSAEYEQDVNELFKPQNMYCVCLSSDWRGYQSLSSATSPDMLATALGDYYELCGELLTKWFPEGNHYTDWIADELFVVAYARDAQAAPHLTHQMILMATELIKARSSFQKKFGFPEAIDIGISCGQSLIGMMGPSWYKKATSLGEIPGQSRRYQTTGKLLRMQRGNTDRIIFGPETLLHISVPFNVYDFTVSPNMKLRDLSSPTLYYIESEKDIDSKLLQNSEANLRLRKSA